MSIRTLLRALWIGCILFGAGILPASAETRRVILLFDERSELPGLATLDADFVRSLNSAGGDGIETYREDMDLSRFGSEPYKTSCAFSAREIRAYEDRSDCASDGASSRFRSSVNLRLRWRLLFVCTPRRKEL